MQDNENKKGLATRDEKIRGCISLVLCLASFTWAYHQTDQAMMAGGITAGVLYMLTTLAFVTKDM
jgi:hypothetical protein